MTLKFTFLDRIVSRNILSAEIRGHSVQNTSEPIKMMFKISSKKYGDDGEIDQFKCVYWNVSKQGKLPKLLIINAYASTPATSHHSDYDGKGAHQGRRNSRGVNGLFRWKWRKSLFGSKIGKLKPPGAAHP